MRTRAATALTAAGIALVGLSVVAGLIAGPNFAVLATAFTGFGLGGAGTIAARWRGVRRSLHEAVTGPARAPTRPMRWTLVAIAVGFLLAPVVVVAPFLRDLGAAVGWSGEPGTVTVTDCSARQCRGTFQPEDGPAVTVAVAGTQHRSGYTQPARYAGGTAYVVTTTTTTMLITTGAVVAFLSLFMCLLLLARVFARPAARRWSAIAALASGALALLLVTALIASALAIGLFGM
jgi:hypothetical protein